MKEFWKEFWKGFWYIFNVLNIKDKIYDEDAVASLNEDENNLYEHFKKIN